MIDFYRPDGTPVAVVRGDPRQLNDASFHAGTNSGSEYEYKDNFNRLHFYVLKKYRDANGVLFYDVGVRRYDGAGPFARNLSLGSPSRVSTDFETAKIQCPADEHRRGRHGHLRLGHLPALGERHRATAGASSCRTRSCPPRPGRRSTCRRSPAPSEGSAGSAVVTADGDERERHVEDADRVVHGLHARGLGRSGEEPGREHGAAEQHREPVPGHARRHHQEARQRQR